MKKGKRLSPLSKGVFMLSYQYNCVYPKSLSELNHIIQKSREITYRTFKKYVDNEILELMNQQRGIRLDQDYAVMFYKSKTENNKPVYYLKESAIEHIFY